MVTYSPVIGSYLTRVFTRLPDLVDHKCEIDFSSLRYETDAFKASSSIASTKRQTMRVSNQSSCRRLGRLVQVGRDEFLDGTILPWAAEWLANYEAWALTGNWFGGATHRGRWDRPPGGDIGHTGRSRIEAPHAI